MKGALASLLVVTTLGGLPYGAISFTARPPLAGGVISRGYDSTPASLSCRLPSIQLHGLTKEGETSTVETTEKTALETTPTAAAADDEKSSCEVEEELSETQKLLQKVKQAGTAGAISYALWELGFWGVSIPVCVVGYRELTGHWPDFTNSEDMQKVGAEAFAFVNFARLAVPLRIGLALSTTPWIDENVVQKFMKKKKDDDEQCEV